MKCSLNGNAAVSATSNLGNERKAWIDFAKFIGLYFVLLSHAEVNIPLLSGLGNLFYICIFFVLAGYTYHDQDMTCASFAKKKAIRILIPYFSYSFLLFILVMLKNIVMGTFQMKEAGRAIFGILYARNYLLHPADATTEPFMTILNAPMWFLPAYFVSFLLFHRLVRWGRERLVAAIFISLTIGVVIHYFCPILLPWSIDTAFIFAGMFGVGYLASYAEQNYSLVRREDFQYLFLVGIFIIMLILQFYNGSMNLSIGHFGKTVYGGFLGAICGSLFIMITSKKLPAKIPALTVSIGQNSLVIMAFHLFFFELIRMAFQSFGSGLWSASSPEAKLIRGILALLTMLVITQIKLIYDKIRTGNGVKNS